MKDKNDSQYTAKLHAKLNSMGRLELIIRLVDMTKEALNSEDEANKLRLEKTGLEKSFELYRKHSRQQRAELQKELSELRSKNFIPGGVIWGVDYSRFLKDAEIEKLKTKLLNLKTELLNLGGKI